MIEYTLSDYDCEGSAERLEDDTDDDFSDIELVVYGKDAPAPVALVMEPRKPRAFVPGALIYGRGPMEAPRVGGVYYFFSPATMTVKVGKTSRKIRGRLSGCQTGSPVMIYTVAWSPDPSEEAAMHERFAAHRQAPRSEWYHLRGDLADHVTALRARCGYEPLDPTLFNPSRDRASEAVAATSAHLEILGKLPAHLKQEALKLLKTETFKSPFRREMQVTLREWLDSGGSSGGPFTRAEWCHLMTKDRYVAGFPGGRES